MMYLKVGKNVVKMEIEENKQGLRTFVLLVSRQIKLVTNIK